MAAKALSNNTFMFELLVLFKVAGMLEHLVTKAGKHPGWILYLITKTLDSFDLSLNGQGPFQL